MSKLLRRIHTGRGSGSLLNDVRFWYAAWTEVEEIAIARDYTEGEKGVLAF